MRSRSKAGLVLATVVSALGAFVPAASAQDLGDWQINAAVDPATICREVQVGSTWQTVCASYGTNKHVGLGATVAPYVSIGCNGVVGCANIGAGVGTTGFLANDDYPLPEVLPSGGVSHPGGEAGKLYANGAAVSVSTPNVCVGTPEECEGGGLVLIIPSA